MWAPTILFLALFCLVGAKKIPVTGLTSGINEATGERPARKDVDGLYRDGGPPWDLYILALQAMQEMNEDDELSYYQIAGIHGKPYVAWNGVGSTPTGRHDGYCPHGELLFGTWHRPYVALFEQELARHVNQIAEQYSGSQRWRYIDAAKMFRLPYWDWPSTQTIPAASSSPTMEVNAPNGTVWIHNPLYSYRFQKFPFDPSFMASGNPLVNFSQTVRCPDSQGISQPQQAKLGGSNLKKSTYRVFAHDATFANATTTALKSNSSFESPHNLVHTHAGCGYHILDLTVSAFDPLLYVRQASHASTHIPSTTTPRLLTVPSMLHHSNVDRLIAMWQAIYYNRSMFTTESQISVHGTFSIPDRTLFNADTSLEPFYNKDGSFWTSNSARHIKSFGYTYPEITDWVGSAENISRSVMQRVNALYGEPLASGRQKRSGPSGGDPLCLTKEYSIWLQVDRRELELPAEINVYLGNDLAGSVAMLGKPNTGMAYETIPLSNIQPDTASRGIKSSQIPQYIERELQLEIRKGTTLVPTDLVPSLKVELGTQDVKPRRSNTEFPSYGVLRKHAIAAKRKTCQ